MIKSHFLSVGSYLPKKILTNEDLEKLVDTSDEWITRRTGIKTRHVVENQKASDLALLATQNCLTSINFQAEHLDAIIVATCTPDKSMPCVANILQRDIGALNAFSFDLNAACSGFLYAISVGDAFIKTGQAKNVLITGVDVMSSIVDWSDRNTCILFGDGAGSVLISSECCTDSSGIFYNKLYCDPSLADALQTNDSGKIVMDGRSIFEHAIKKLMAAITDALKINNLSSDDIDHLIIHQANARIIDAIAQRLGIKSEKVVFTIEQSANTSAATIPIALDFVKKNNGLKNGDNILLAAMGAGFTWAVCMLTI